MLAWPRKAVAMPPCRFLSLLDLLQHPCPGFIRGHSVRGERWTRIALAKLFVVSGYFLFKSQHFLGVVAVVLSQKVELQLAYLWIPAEYLLIRRGCLEKGEQVLHGQLPVGELRSPAAILTFDRSQEEVWRLPLRSALGFCLLIRRQEEVWRLPLLSSGFT